MGHFVNYYELLQISPRAEVTTINRVYKLLAARYHPDQPSTGDAEKFLVLRDAYDTLRDPDRRLAYDADYERHQAEALPEFLSPDFDTGTEVEANRRLGVLSLLYAKRRNDPDVPLLSMLELEVRTGLPREHLMFTVWYLRGRRFVDRNDDGSLLITADGVDFLESHMPSNHIVMKLLKAHCAGETEPRYESVGA